MKNERVKENSLLFLIRKLALFCPPSELERQESAQDSAVQAVSAEEVGLGLEEAGWGGWPIGTLGSLLLLGVCD